MYKDIVKEELEKGNMSFYNTDGLQCISLEEVFKKDIDDILYMLNRSDDTLMRMADNQTNVQWINEYALTYLLKHFYNLAQAVKKVEEHKSEQKNNHTNNKKKQSYRMGYEFDFNPENIYI